MAPKLFVEVDSDENHVDGVEDCMTLATNKSVRGVMFTTPRATAIEWYCVLFATPFAVPPVRATAQGSV